MNSDEVYRPPAGYEPAEHSRFSAEEWRYMGRVFLLWLVGGALLLALVRTGQNYFALSQFGGEEYLARVMTIEVVSRNGPGLVIAAACNTLAMVTERRAKRSILEPVSEVPWSVIGLLVALSPVATGLILALSLAIITFIVKIPFDTSLVGIRAGMHLRDVVISISAVLACAFGIMGVISQVMRVLSRFRGWLLLKFIIVSQIVGVLFSLVDRMASLVL
ncbi:MAG TPA: hypothetical protein PK156_28645 [Polyangium sp.]|nr:hypothetical protein [Polyangium sp.]